MLTSIVIFQVLENKRDSIIRANNIEAFIDLSLVLVLKGDTLNNQLHYDDGDSPSEWDKLYEFIPLLSDEEIVTIFQTKKIDTLNPDKVIVHLQHNEEVISVDYHMIKKNISFNHIYLHFFNSPHLTEAFKLDILHSSCCLLISEYPDYYSNQASHVFIEGKGYGFLWSLENGKTFFVQFTHEPYSEIFVIVLIFFLAIVSMLFVVWYGLVYVDRRFSLNGINVFNSSGVLKELTDSFDPMTSHIQRLLKVQREMINAISHELRTPIARLRFGLEVLKDEVPDIDLMIISALEDDIEELNILVDEVLTYGKLGEGSFNLLFEKVSVKSFLNGILQHNAPLLSHLAISVSCVECEFDDGFEVVADIHHLHRAFQNLILNASKYANSKIQITFKQHDENWQLDIEDDGPGIKVEDREKIFMPFQRLDDSRTRASGGYGLGLAIVQKIAFWHGGSIVIGDADIGGAKFSFTWSRRYHEKEIT